MSGALAGSSEVSITDSLVIVAIVESTVDSMTALQETAAVNENDDSDHPCIQKSNSGVLND